MRFARAFGLSLDFGDLRPPGAWTPPPDPEAGRRPKTQMRPEPHTPSEPALRIELASQLEIDAAWSGCSEIGWQTRIDGSAFAVEIGREGDHRFVHGRPDEPCDVHHLSADARLLRCAPRDPEQALWWRVVLDSVLFTVALLHGRQALHAAAVATPAGAIAIAAPSGGGKSTLLAELVRRGLPLLADDILALTPRPASPPLAHPAPPLMTLSAAKEPGAPPLGETVLVLDDERWISVAVHPRPLPLAAIVLLDRGGQAPGCVQPAQTTLAPLIASLLRFPRTTAQERVRFEFAAEISAHVPVLALSAPASASPADLLELLEAQHTLAIGGARS